MKKVLLGSILFLAIAITSYSQNRFNMSQYMLHQAFVNPAAIANNNFMNGAIFHRSQWVGFDGAPTTTGLNFTLPGKSQKSFYGINIMNDKIGVNKAFELAGNYAYRVQVAESKYLAFALAANVNFVQSNFAAVNTDQPNDPYFTGNTPTFVMPNFRFGTYHFSPKYYVGLAINNLLENKVEFQNAYKGQTQFNVSDFHYYIQGGYLFKISEKFDIGASTMIKNVNNSPLQVDLNAQAIYLKKYGFGFSYRSSKELVILANAAITSKIRLGYAYDLGFSNLKNYNSGSHEIMLIFSMNEEKLNVRPFAPRF
ncbi:MAG: type IX secretion system membrane protein PorP/SprF [Bacteroidetes bacterium]|nr:type IX secretion system membrane protein PorP/SprF [Bacteroidota bacterium]